MSKQPREIGTLRDDYRPPHIVRDLDAQLVSPAGVPIVREWTDPKPIVDLDAMERRIGAKPLDEIAALVQSLTYGQMMDLAAALWAAKPEVDPWVADAMPKMLHEWSRARRTAS